MKSKTSFWNKSLVRYFFNNIVWLALIYFIGLLLIHIPALITQSNHMEHLSGQEGFAVDIIAYFRQVSAVQYVFTLVIVTIIAITQFDYKNHEASSDFIHALPIKRTHILTQGIIVGMSILFILTAIVGLIIYLLTFGLVFDLPFSEIVKWILYSWYVIFVTYSFTLFVGMFVKRAVLQAIFTAAMMLLPYITWVLSQFAATMLFNGVTIFTPLETRGIDQFFESTAFPMHIVTSLYTGYGTSIIFWILFATVLIVATYFLYNRHHVERTEQAFYFKWLHILLSAWLSTLGMLVFGSFMSIVFGNIFVTIASYMLGLALAYLIVEMILQFTPRIKLSVNSMIATAVFAIVFWIVFIISWHIHFTTIPDLEDIDAAYINDSSYQHYNYIELQNAGIINENYGLSTKQSDIEFFHNVHKEILEDRSNIFSFISNGWQNSVVSNEVNITYRLNNGDVLHRTFFLDNEEDLYVEIIDRMSPSNIIDGIIKPEAVTQISLTTYADTLYFEGNSSVEFVENFQAADERDQLPISRIPNYLKPMLYADISFDVDGYHYWIGDQRISNLDIYNRAIQDALLERQEADNIPIAESIGLTYSEDIYVANVSNDLDEFIEAVNNETVQDVFETYDFEQTEDEVLEELFDKVNDAAFDGNGELVLLYVPVYASDYETVEPLEDFYESPFDHTRLNILVLED